MLVLTEPISSGRVAGRPAREDGAERPHLDRVAQRRPGAVRLDVVDVRRRDPGAAERLADHRLLGGAVGRGEPAAGAVLVDRRAADDRQHAIAVGQRRPTGA